MPSAISILAIIYFPLLINCLSDLKKVNNLQQFIATEKIEAEFYTSATYANTYDDCTQDPSLVYLGDLSTGTHLQYDQVDFGSGVERVSLRVANVDSSAAVEIGLQVSTSVGLPGPPILTVPINFTGSDQCAFVTVDVALEIHVSAKLSLYITIPSGEGGQLFLDWFQFSHNSSGQDVRPATERIQAENFDYAEGTAISHNCSDAAIHGDSYSWHLVEYYAVDFGVDGVQSVSVRAYTFETDTPSIGFVDGTTLNTLATVEFKNVGNSCNFTEVSADVTFSPTGVHNLLIHYFDGSYTYIDSFVFVPRDRKWNATDKMEAEDYTSANNTWLFADCGDSSISYVGALQADSGLEYDGVDFGSGVDTVTLRVSNTYTGSPLKVALHLGSSTTTPFVTISVGQTGTGSCDFNTITTFLDTRPIGLQKLFFTFPSMPGEYLNLDWFQFNPTLN